MRYRRLLVLSVIGLAVSFYGHLAAWAQEGATQGASLGNLARQLRAQREKATQKPAKIYTNDNLPARPAPGALTVAAHISETEGAEGEAAGAEATSGESAAPEEAAKETAEKQPAGTEATTPGPPEAESEDVHDEKYYRKKIGELRTRLELHKRQLAVLEQKLAQGQMQFYGDPQKTLEQESTPAFRGDVTKLQQEIDQKRQDIAAAEQAISDLQDQLRREGSPPGWLR